MIAPLPILRERGGNGAEQPGGYPYHTTTVSRFAARVTPVYSHRLRLSENAADSSNSTTSSHCEPCALCTVKT